MVLSVSRCKKLEPVHTMLFHLDDVEEFMYKVISDCLAEYVAFHQ